MFDSLAQRFSQVFSRLRGKGALSEAEVEQSLREIRIALLEADVALPVVKDFVQGVREKAVGQKLIKNIRPDQLMIKIVHQQLVESLSHPLQDLNLKNKIFLLVGLQASGKTTMCAKLAYLLKEQGKNVLLASVDIYRPAARQQLEILSKSIQVDSLEIISDQSVSQIIQQALQMSKNYDAVIFDTAGRVHLDDHMMQELVVVQKTIQAGEILFVADALMGQSAVEIAKAFKEVVPVSGICLSRIDAESRAGMALSVRKALDLPIKLMGVGEKPAQVLQFDPQRIAGRILDQGDVVELVEKAAKVIDEKEQQRQLVRLQKGIFTLEDLALQLGSLNKMGGIKSVLNLLPGIGQVKSQLKEGEFDEKVAGASFKKEMAIISSMTVKERRSPAILNGSRKQRIAMGSGTSVQAVNQLLQKYEQMHKMIKQFSKMKWPGSGLKN